MGEVGRVFRLADQRQRVMVGLGIFGGGGADEEGGECGGEGEAKQGHGREGCSMEGMAERSAYAPLMRAQKALERPIKASMAGPATK